MISHRTVKLTRIQCDEKKPSCSSCEKRSRQCNYSFPYGQGFALVMQDPSQMTKYGRSITASIVHSLAPVDEGDPSNTSTSTSDTSLNASPVLRPKPNDLHLKSGMVAANGQGVFQTLAPARSKLRKTSKKVEANQRRRWQEHLRCLQQEDVISLHRPSSSSSRLIAMFVHMLHPESPQHQPLFSLGNWIRSIPARIESNSVLSIATELFVRSFEYHRHQSHSNKLMALQTKARALKPLQLSISASSQQHPTYDLIAAIKLHYAAEVVPVILIVIRAAYLARYFSELIICIMQSIQWDC